MELRTRQWPSMAHAEAVRFSIVLTDVVWCQTMMSLIAMTPLTEKRDPLGAVLVRLRGTAGRNGGTQ